MRVTILWCVLSLLVLTSEVTSFKILASMYSGSSSSGGVDLSKYPIKQATLKNGKRVNLYPVAVLPGDVKKSKYRVLEIRHGKKKAYCHVVDTCGSGDCWTNKWKAKRLGRMLVDVHQSAWKPLGLGKFTLHRLDAKWTRTKIDRNSKAIKQVITSDGKHDYVPPRWK